MPPPVSVALPVHRADGRFPRALACIQHQTLPDLDVLLIPNGADADTAALARALADREPRARILTLPRASLSEALNAALRAARHEFVARMDADDECAATRLALQAEYLAAHGSIAALGTAFEGVGGDGRSIGIDRPPCDPGEIRWRLCLGNLFCHGSMMLRRSAVLEAGGYDESRAHAQDYDLWLRLSLSHRLANLPHVLYTYRTSLDKRHESQARSAADAMARHWSRLPPSPQQDQPRVATLLAQSTWGGARARSALAALETLLSERGPTPQTLLAWQWIAARAGATGPEPAERLKLDRLRRAGERIRAAGLESIWLYGAGRHTAWLLENLDALGVEIAGIADDARAGQSHHGWDIAAPGAIPPGAGVLLSSDAHEGTMWSATAPLRERGVSVWRLHTGGARAVDQTPAMASAGITPPGRSMGA